MAGRSRAGGQVTAHAQRKLADRVADKLAERLEFVPGLTHLAVEVSKVNLYKVVVGVESETVAKELELPTAINGVTVEIRVQAPARSFSA